MNDGPRALVTGATGFTGRHLCRHLVEAGYQVTALVRQIRQVPELERSGVRLVSGDVRDRAAVEQAMQGMHIVFHVAAAFRDASLSDEVLFDVNVEGTRTLVTAAAAAGVKRFVHCSTIGVHGDTGKTPANEESPFRAPDSYCQSKIEGERLARELFADLGLPGCIFRPMGIYGPADTRFLKLFRSIARRRFVMIGSGDVLYHLTYVDDLCRGIMLCGEHPDAAGEVFLLGGEHHTTLNELVACIAESVGVKPPSLKVPMAPVLAVAHVCEAVCKPLGLSPPLYPRRVEFFSKDRAADISKARRMIGYDPRVSLAEGVDLTARWYRQQGWL